MIYNADCLDVLKTMEGESVDCVVTDCPYHIVSGGCTNDAVKIGRYREAGGVLNHKQYEATALSEERAIHNTRKGKIFEHNDIEFDDWLPEIYRVLKDKAHCYIMINPRNLKELWGGAEKAGFTFQNLLVWDKGNTTPNKYYMNAYELILMLRKGGAKNINNMGTKNILRIPNITRVKKHPTEKPVELMKVLIENSTNENDVVVDPFMGAGATGVACNELNREFIGVEIDEKYFRIAQERIEGMREDKEEISGQINIFDVIGEEK